MQHVVFGIRKGDTCSFLHANDISLATRSTKTVFPSGNASSSEDKTASGNKKGLDSTDADAFLHPSKKVACPKIDVTFQCSSLGQPSENVSHQSASAKILLLECEKVAVDELLSSSPAVGSNDSTSHVHAVADQRYEEPMTDSTEEGNLSPGFDVVVGDGSGNLASHDDPEYILSTNLEQREQDPGLCRENFEDHIAYEPMHSDLELLYEHEMHSYNHLETEPVLFNDRNIISCPRGKLIKSMFSQKKRLTLVNLDSEEWNHADLRSYLQRDSVSGNRSIVSLSRRRNQLSCRMSGNFVKPRKPGLYQPPLGRRLALQVGKISRVSPPENITFSNGFSQYGSFRHSRQHRPCGHYDEYAPTTPQQTLSNMSRKSISREPVVRDRGLNPKSVPFKGPKTLSQIKEEKRKVEENGGFSIEKRRSIGAASSSTDFRGPKPLSDILKDKRKVEEEEELVKEMNRNHILL